MSIRPGNREFPWSRPPGAARPRGNLEREEVLAYLHRLGGGHLVIVRYAPGHNVHDEWVYNAAGIDRSEVAFAREMDAVSDRKPIEYFKDRTVWTMLPDASPASLIGYRKREQ